MKSKDSDSGSSQFEQIDSVNMNDIPDPFRDSIAYRASMAARIGDVNDIKTLKQKIKILKAAVLKERETKMQMEKKIEQLSASYVDAQKLIEKKEETIIYQEQQLQQFREKLVLLGHESNKYLDLYHKTKNQIIQQNDSTAIKQVEDGDSIISSFKQIIGFSSGSSSQGSQNAIAEIQRLQKENFMLKEEIEKQKVALNNAESKGKQDAMDISKKQMQEVNKKIEQLNSQIQELKDKVVDTTTQLQNKTQELQEKDQLLTQLKQETNSKNQIIEKMKNELEFTNDKCKKMDSKITNYLSEIEQKTNKITQIEAQYELIKVDKESLQQQVDQMDSKVMLFTMRRIQGLYEDPCQIICRKDLEGQHILDFDTVKEKFSLNALDIRDILCEFEPEPILTLQLGKNQTIIFKGGSDLRIIEKKLRNFLNGAPVKRTLTRQQTNKQQQGQQQQGLLDNMFSFLKQ
ncbi:hypothetical protein TTHERM_00077140 (macronuclear) [Tetrahymena thermophila SB210]|uniref:Uncharacterized protein n=1 Tax=Tetrahymena thermophila (strain SB210) TaxID=312017 RepID=Q23G50_TETTS|nr:hypothetical protein TTHERM_00077140 [Tetrahymena thermophila SB210]EAR95410.2 hypothetical protein TTHERM_00077140 [Tetrahymena thermophila SB210]|eukprot:XP_001015655.2 hypothetical protein TTHERM_00077140 [Tetrahymena thermophila SB210]